jgi:hypothetical protein
MLRPKADDDILMRCKIGQVFVQHVARPCREACVLIQVPRALNHT